MRTISKNLGFVNSRERGMLAEYVLYNVSYPRGSQYDMNAISYWPTNERDVTQETLDELTIPHYTRGRGVSIYIPLEQTITL